MVKRRFDINFQRQTIVMLCYVSLTLSLSVSLSLCLFLWIQTFMMPLKNLTQHFLCLFVVYFFYIHGYIYWQLTIKTWSTVKIYVCICIRVCVWKEDEEKLRKPFCLHPYTHTHTGKDKKSAYLNYVIRVEYELCGVYGGYCTPYVCESVCV